VETGDADPCGFPQRTAGFPSRQGTHQTDRDCFRAGIYLRTGTATPVPSPTVECPYDNAPLPERSIFPATGLTATESKAGV